MAVEAIEYRANIKPEVVLRELMESCDLAMPVDAADSRVEFAVRGWFVFPAGSLSKGPKEPA